MKFSEYGFRELFSSWPIFKAFRKMRARIPKKSQAIVGPHFFKGINKKWPRLLFAIGANKFKAFACLDWSESAN